MASISPNNLCKCWKNQPETLTSFIIVSLAACLQPTAADFVPYLDKRSLFGTISFIKEFNFDI